MAAKAKVQVRKSERPKPKASERNRPEAQILDIPRRTRMANESDIQVVLEELVGFVVCRYAGKLPAPYEWGRTYFRDDELACLELVDSSQVHHVWLADRHRNNSHFVDAITNIRMVERFGIAEIDEQLKLKRIK